MAKTLTAIEKIKAHMAAGREDGMEAAQVILILVLVVIGLVPVLIGIKNALGDKASDVENSITDGDWGAN